MRERINRLARGIIDSSVPELVIKPERIEGSFHRESPCGENFPFKAEMTCILKGWCIPEMRE